MPWHPGVSGSGPLTLTTARQAGRLLVACSSHCRNTPAMHLHASSSSRTHMLAHPPAHPSPHPLPLAAQDRSSLLMSTSDPSMLVHALIDSIVDHALPVLEAFSSRLAELEDAVLLDKPDIVYTKEVHMLQADLGLLKRSLVPTKFLVESLINKQVGGTAWGGRAGSGGGEMCVCVCGGGGGSIDRGRLEAVGR
jgi:hypothetical protein